MDPLHHESGPILPRQLLYALSAILIATVAFMALSGPLMGVEYPSWMLPLTAAVFVLIILMAAVLRLTVDVYEDRLVIAYAVRRIEIPVNEVLDRREGELTAIRNYSNWNLKGVKHRAYVRIGDESGVAIKLTGKRVVVVSSADPVGLSSMLPRNESE